MDGHIYWSCDLYFSFDASLSTEEDISLHRPRTEEDISLQWPWTEEDDTKCVVSGIH